MNKFKLISNTNTINLVDLKINDPISYGILCFTRYLKSMNLTFIYINHDKNRIYFKISKNGNKSYIMDLTYKEFKNLDFNNFLNNLDYEYNNLG